MTAHDTPPDEDSHGRLWYGFLEVGLLVTTLVWTAFWLNVARLNWTLDGQALTVLFLFGTLVAPAVVLYGDHALSMLDRTDYEHEVLEELPTSGAF